MLLHDFPEFLCDYHFSFCDVIPPNCIQMRNLILSAFPRNMRLPDPFTPNLKVRNSIKYILDFQILQKLRLHRNKYFEINVGTQLFVKFALAMRISKFYASTGLVLNCQLIATSDFF